MRIHNPQNYCSENAGITDASHQIIHGFQPGYEFEVPEGQLSAQRICAQKTGNRYLKESLPRQQTPLDRSMPPIA
jgi:hypothetical protein